MSVGDEREPLAPRTTSLYDYALFRHGIDAPDGRVPAGGYPLPDGFPAVSRRDRLDFAAAKAAVTEALVPLLADPISRRAADAVHLRLAALPVPRRTVHRIVCGIVPEERYAGRARRLARRLTRTGTHPSAVLAGLALLVRLGEPEDVPTVRALGRLREFSSAAIAALDRIDRHAAAEAELRRLAEPPPPNPLLDAVTGGDRGAARAALIHSATVKPVGPPRRVAEAARLDELLREYPEDPDLTGAAGRLLFAMSQPNQYRPEILDYAQARPVYESVVAGAHRLTPSARSYALLLALALDLYSGAGAVLDWPAGRRTELLDALGRLLDGPAWAAVADSTGWVRRTGRTPFARPAEAEAFRIEVVAADPEHPNLVETRILRDGGPVALPLFASGSTNPPEYLLDTGRLRAGPEPREVQLAEAYCTEGCCGALYVTISRDGDEVVWDDWRGVEKKRRATAYRFDAAAYDAEVERAERDRSWSWPARDTARLISREVREHPGLLAAWDCRAGTAFTAWDEPESVELLFTYAPGQDAAVRGTNAPWLQFACRIPDDGTPPEEQARAVLDRIAAEDPRDWGRVCGGSKEYAAALGYDWPPGGP
ncbi:hypothetical protein [Streptomyces erythrochromogenes]|uniref:hypothetical protein n=1 Tax=Streptomyces erythrochromogenes TaxID=285574 RepID=UPI0036B73B05